MNYITNLDRVCRSTEHPNSVKLLEYYASNSSKQWCLKVLFYNNQPGYYTVPFSIETPTHTKFINWLFTKTPIEILPLEPIGKLCGFVNGLGERIVGTCVGADFNEYKVQSGEFMYWTKTLEIL